MNALYSDYENLLIGRLKDLPACHFYGQKPVDFNQKLAISLFRYAAENVLGWSCEETIRKFDRYMFTKMKLTKLFKYIDWPTEIEVGDPLYFCYLAYPGRVHLNMRKLVEDLFLRVLDDEMSFPREYFSGNEGFRKYCICFCYLITNYKTFSTVESIYQFFLSEEGSRFLDIHRLKTPKDVLSIDICDVIHSVTSAEQESEFYYGYYKFNQAWKRVRKGIT